MVSNRSSGRLVLAMIEFLIQKFVSADAVDKLRVGKS